MADIPDRFVVITESGLSWSLLVNVRTYWQVLDQVYAAGQTAGSVYDHPNMLIANGKVVVDQGLHQLAYRYGQAVYEAQAAARARVQALHKPEWL